MDQCVSMFCEFVDFDHVLSIYFCRRAKMCRRLAPCDRMIHHRLCVSIEAIFKLIHQVLLLVKVGLLLHNNRFSDEFKIFAQILILL